MWNSFEDDAATFVVLVNGEGQYSLWPESVAVPAGWSVALPGGSRQECLDYVDETWTDMRPKSLARLMNAEAGPAPAGT
ncbi:MbtH family protein [Streptomyces scopuliridis]|uniref:MbtH family protein n=1 Tax=Streptomyces scopuliridis TaxID=452529 RepID=UPI0036B1A655